MRTFTRKGYGRIYVDGPKLIEVQSIIENMDEYEYSYLPEGFIAPFSQYPALVYTGKFDALDIDALTAICFSKGIHVFCLDNGHEEYCPNAITTP